MAGGPHSARAARMWVPHSGRVCQSGLTRPPAAESALERSFEIRTARMFQRVQDQVAPAGGVQEPKPAVTTEGDEVQVLGVRNVFPSPEAWKDYPAKFRGRKKSQTGLRIS
jgi:hypothetical protein